MKPVLILALVLLMPALARAVDERPPQSTSSVATPATAVPAAPAPPAPSCECGGPGQCCGGQMPMAAETSQPPRQAGCGCSRAKRNAERR